MNAREKIIEWIIRICGVSAIFFVFGIFAFVLKESWGFLQSGFDFHEFFFTSEWRPTSGKQVTYGTAALFAGTVGVVITSMVIAVPFGLGTAVLISEFCTPRWQETLKIVVELLAAIPSVVWGFIGMTLINSLIIQLFGVPVGLNVFNAGVLLALMAFPIIVSISEDALRAVPDSYREAAEALGATRWQVVYRVLFPGAKSGLLAAVLLGVGRAFGETMAVLMATGHSLQIPFSSEFPFFHPLTSVSTLTATIAAELGETAHGTEHRQALFMLGLVLFVITFLINLIADVVVRGIRKE